MYTVGLPKVSGLCPFIQCHLQDVGVSTKRSTTALMLCRMIAFGTIGVLRAVPIDFALHLLEWWPLRSASPTDAQIR